MAMSDAHREKLRRNQVDLVQHLKVDEEFLSYMVRDNIITDEMKEEIQVGKTKQARASTFLSILPKRGAIAFPCFIEALVETHQDEDLILNLDPDCKFHRPVVEEEEEEENEGPWVAGSSTAPNITNAEVDSVTEQIKRQPNDVTMLNSSYSETDGGKFASKKVYPMKNACHGKAVIIRYGTTTNGDPSHRDSQLLGTLFRSLKFTVITMDASDEEVALNALRAEAKRQTTSDEAFVLFVLCAEESPPNHNKITKLFDGKNCEKLIKTPKLYFIQSSRRLQKSASTNSSTMSTSVTSSSDSGRNQPGRDETDGGEGLSTSSSSSSLGKPQHEKRHAQVIRFYDFGIVPGSGTSVCMTALVQCIRLYGSQFQLYDLLILVDKVVKKLCEEWKYPIEGVVHHTTTTTLEHAFYFRP
jgi:hypothetical protein